MRRSKNYHSIGDRSCRRSWAHTLRSCIQSPNSVSREWPSWRYVGARLYGPGLAVSVGAGERKHTGLPAVVGDCALVPEARRDHGARPRGRRPKTVVPQGQPWLPQGATALGTFTALGDDWSPRQSRPRVLVRRASYRKGSLRLRREGQSTGSHIVVQSRCGLVV